MDNGYCDKGTEHAGAEIFSSLDPSAVHGKCLDNYIPGIYCNDNCKYVSCELDRLLCRYSALQAASYIDVGCVCAGQNFDGTSLPEVHVATYTAPFRV